MNELVEFSVSDERSRKISVFTSCEEEEPVSEVSGICFVGFFKAKTFEGLFLEIFFTKQESVSEQILPAAERKCWRSAAVGEGNSSQKLNRVCQLHLRRS